MYEDEFSEDTFDCFYDEPSEYEQMVEDLKEKLRQSVKKEILEELERLRRQAADLQDLKNNWNERCRKHDEEHGRAMQELEQTRRDLKRMRASELLQEFSEELYGIDYKYEYLPKCDRCDQRRRRITKGQAGNPIIEVCECSRIKTTYSVRSSRPVKVYFNDRDGEVKASAYYLFRSDEESCYPTKVNISDDVPFEQLERKHYEIAFRSQEKAQAYCDYLNATEEWRYGNY